MNAFPEMDVIAFFTVPHHRRIQRSVLEQHGPIERPKRADGPEACRWIQLARYRGIEIVREPVGIELKRAPELVATQGLHARNHPDERKIRKAGIRIAAADVRVR